MRWRRPTARTVRTTLAVAALYGVLLQGLFGALRPVDPGPAEIALHAVLCSAPEGSSGDGRAPSPGASSCCTVLCGAGPLPIVRPTSIASAVEREAAPSPIERSSSAVAAPLSRPSAFEARGPPVA